MPDEMTLDDAARVKVLSPGMLVAKRFFRNKLAIIGLVVIIFMFLFSFLGGMLMPYSESQVFYRTEEMKKDYAGATFITDFQLYGREDTELPSDIYSKTVLAITKNANVVETRKNGNIALRKLKDDIYVIYAAEEIKLPPVLKSDECKNALKDGDGYFVLDGTEYVVSEDGKKQSLYTVSELAVAAKLSFTPFEADTALSYEFYKNALVGISENKSSFEAMGASFSIELEGSSAAMVKTADNKDFVYISDMNINSVVGGVFLNPEFKEAVTLAIANGEDSFTYTNENGETDEYLLSEKNGQHLIQRFQQTRVIDTYAKPGKEHLFGTDANGMDLLARLMYGGRISLMIGFVVILIEVFIGVIVGGIAGYFGGWVDNLFMRFVDVIYCIPSMPLYLILGSIMDHYRASATTRIYMLCIIMSVIGWVGIARIVRGQILSLREQEFMVATEALGIRVSRRIFKHLIPNVVPQLIVFATMGLGDVILAEATLSFLGLGIKYPAASWGSIINAVNDSYVMTNYLHVWVPAGMLILLTVLAFNFIGDGLRDAFDPKMKR